MRLPSAAAPQWPQCRSTACSLAHTAADRPTLPSNCNKSPESDNTRTAPACAPARRTIGSRQRAEQGAELAAGGQAGHDLGQHVGLVRAPAIGPRLLARRVGLVGMHESGPADVVAVLIVGHGN